MSEIVRLYSYKDLFAGRRAVGKAEIMAKLEISEATFKRDIAKLRDQLHMPIAFNRDLGGYTMAPGHDDTELPGLWFNQDELLALVTIQQLLEQRSCRDGRIKQILVVLFECHNQDTFVQK